MKTCPGLKMIARCGDIVVESKQKWSEEVENMKVNLARWSFRRGQEIAVHLAMQVYLRPPIKALSTPSDLAVGP